MKMCDGPRRHFTESNQKLTSAQLVFLQGKSKEKVKVKDNARETFIQGF